MVGVWKLWDGMVCDMVEVLLSGGFVEVLVGCLELGVL